MTAKRFRVNELVKYNYSDIGEYIDENHTDKPLRNDEVAGLLNELHEENENLKDVNVQCCNDYSAMRRDVLRYKKENEQLKKQIGNLEHTRDFADEVCADCERLEHKNEQLKSFIRKLQGSDGNIILINGYGHTKSYVERLLK